MMYRDNIAAIEELAASEGGVFTTAQAARLGIPRDSLAYAARAGRIERIAHGAYRLSAAEDDGLDELRAVWKLTAPDRFSNERANTQDWDGVVVCGPTAASILEIGDFYASPYHIAAPKRINSRRKDVRFVRADVTRGDIMLRAGLPVMRVEATISSLVNLREDPSLVADAFVDAVRRYGSTSFNLDRLIEMIGESTFARIECDAGAGPHGSRKLIRLDGLGHIAIAEAVGT